jgi:EAL domain-containing protein (putative c-di-GMP-specific phosphodiesterase class I)
MYAAKAEGRRTFRFFEPEFDIKAQLRLELESDLRQALANKEFEIYYQPLVDLAADTVSGCEALLRWQHPNLGMISPADFIPIAEQTGLIIEIGEWVLKQSCLEAASWPDGIRVAINVSPVQFRARTLPLKVAAALSESGLAPDRLELEITETVLIHDDEQALAILGQLRDLGVRIALDDFGTGYSSLSYLHRFPFDKIKIDRSFVEKMGDELASSEVVSAMIGLGRGLGLTVIAEGIEGREQESGLKDKGCEQGQGYLFGRAVSAEDTYALFAASDQLRSLLKA